MMDMTDKLNTQIKVSIVMAYYNRKEQLIQALNSIYKSAHKNIEIIIVDDASDEDQSVYNFIDDIDHHKVIKLITIKKEQKTWVNPCIPYNIGFKQATGDIIIVQNPEIMHIGDCVTDVVNNLNERDWMSFNCWGSPSFSVNKSFESKTDMEINDFLHNVSNRIGGNSVERDDVGGWLNHYKKHFVAYHYLAAIYRKDLFTIMDGGFNEEFKNSVGADDDEFIKRLIYNNFTFKIRKITDSSPVGIHLFHEKPKQMKQFNWRVNKKIFDKCCHNMGFSPQNNPNLAPKSEIPMAKQYLL